MWMSISPLCRTSQSTGEVWRHGQRCFDRFAENELGHVVLLGEAQERLSHVRPGRGNDFRSQPPREREIAVELRLLFLAQRPPGIDVRHDPRSLHRGRQPPGVTDQFFRGGSAADGDEQTIAAFPRSGDPFLLHDVAQIAIDMFGHDAQRHFAQRGEIALAKEVLRRRRGAVAEINFAFGKPRAQLLRGKIDRGRSRPPDRGRNRGWFPERARR